MEKLHHSVGADLDSGYLFSSPHDLDLVPGVSDDGRWVQPTSVDQEELLFNVYVYPDCGEIIQAIQLSPVPERMARLHRLLNSTGATVVNVLEAATPNFIMTRSDRPSSSPGRAFNEVRRRMMQGALTTHARLGYDSLPTLKTVKRDIAKFAARLRKIHKPLHYVAVPERGQLTGALHWHVAMPYFISQSEIESAWIRGDVHVSRMYDYDSMERFVGYITKTFRLDASEREFPHRYKRDKRLKIQRQVYEGLTQAEVELLIEDLVGLAESTLHVRESIHPWVTATYRWSPRHLEKAFLH